MKRFIQYLISLFTWFIMLITMFGCGTTDSYFQALPKTSPVPGAQGETGSKGDPGFNGTNGLAGAQGIQGLAGANGVNGSQGVQGIQGVAGLNGTNGTNGSNGATGAQGATGATGASGMVVTSSVTITTMNTCMVVGDYSVKYTTGNQTYIWPNLNCDGTGNTALLGTTSVCHYGTPVPYVAQQCMINVHLIALMQGAIPSIKVVLITF